MSACMPCIGTLTGSLYSSQLSEPLDVPYDFVHAHFRRLVLFFLNVSIFSVNLFLLALSSIRQFRTHMELPGLRADGYASQ